MVSGFASCIERPTGTKSQPTCTLMANSAGRAKAGDIAPAPIWVPIITPMTCEMAAPGPSTGERNGMPQMSDSSTSPHSEFASGVRAWAIRLPSAVSCTRAISSETKAINGITLRSDTSTASRLAANSRAITCPTAVPVRSTMRTSFSAPRAGGGVVIIRGAVTDTGSGSPSGASAVSTRTSCSIVTPET